MARGRRTVSRMEKFVEQALTNVSAASSVIFPYQLDGGEVEAQVKRIMLSLAQSGGTSADFTFKLGLFQFAPTAADFNQDEAIVISGAVGNQCWHNETITMRVPKDWFVALQITNVNPANARDCVYSLQLNYKVLN